MPVFPILLYSKVSRAGKNFAAKALAQQFQAASLEEKFNVQFNTKEYSSAAKFKGICVELFGELGIKGASIYEAFGDLRKKPLANGMTPVDIWIEFGEFCKKIYPEVWVSQTFKDIFKDAVALDKVHYPTAGIYRPQVLIPIVTDLRFDVEYDYLKARFKNMVVVEIMCRHSKGVVNKMDGKLTRKCDLQIDNDGTSNFTKLLGEYATTICDHIATQIKE